MSHELDEFLMVEKPLTHTKRKAHPDLEKMKPELRQLEEQYVVAQVPFTNPLTETFLRTQIYRVRLHTESADVVLSP